MLQKYSNYMNEICQFIIMSIQFLLTHNYFSFGDSIFLQMLSAPMGSKFSPIFANPFMSYWEGLYILCDENPFTGLRVWYGDYIDDLKLIWGQECGIKTTLFELC